ncbi:MAG: right-handed parallel beta-helix repeat-containing protein [Clostridiales bacterium]|nr:right-handed parallel beta-helix repeat-containing protein [Clostridiales bacterium]
MDDLAIADTTKNRLDLSQAIASTGKLKETDYTEQTWLALVSALSAAKDITDESLEDAVREALTALTDAISKLERPAPIDPYASPGDTEYYIAKAGSDDNNGLEGSPWKSIAKVNSVTFAPGDKIYFKSGDAWEGAMLELHGSGSADKPIVVSKYGGEAKPIINAQGAEKTITIIPFNSDISMPSETKNVSASVYLENGQYWEITNLEVTNHAASLAKGTGVRDGILIRNDSVGKLSHIYVMDCYVHDIYGQAGLKDYWGNAGILYMIEFYANGQDGRQLSLYDDILISGNTIRSVQRQGIVIHSRQNLRPEMDHRNKTYYGNDGLSDWLPSTNVVIRNNYLDNIGGDGILPQETIGAIVEYNTVNGFNTWVGGQAGASAGMWAWNADDTVFQFNESYGGAHTPDGQAFDVDYCQTGTIYQYNYSHDNIAGFMLLCSIRQDGEMAGNELVNGVREERTDAGVSALLQMRTRDPIIRYNITQNERGAIYSFSGYSDGALIYNNTHYQAPGTSVRPVTLWSWGAGYPTSVSFFNNIFDLQGTTNEWHLTDTGTHATLTADGELNKTNTNITKQVSIQNLKFDYNLINGSPGANAPIANGTNNIVGQDPLLVNPGAAPSSVTAGAPDSEAMKGYALLEGSPAIGAGLVIETAANEIIENRARVLLLDGAEVGGYNVRVPYPREDTLTKQYWKDALSNERFMEAVKGGRDYFGNTVNYDEAPNIGAYNGSAVSVNPDKATYYIDAKNGADDNDGLSPDTAWSTLKNVNTAQFKPEDQILFKADGEWHGAIAPKGDGVSLKHPITIGSYGEGEPPIIDGFGAEAAITLTNQSFWAIQDIHLKNTSESGEKRYGVNIKGTTGGVTLRRLTVKDIEGAYGAGVNIEGTTDAAASNVSITDSVFENIGGDAIRLDYAASPEISGNEISGADASGVSVMHSPNPTIKGNRIISSNGVALYIGTGSQNPKIHYNFSLGNALGFVEITESSSTVTKPAISHNISEDDGGVIMRFRGRVGSWAAITHNTVYLSNTSVTNVVKLEAAGSYEPEHLYFKNNIFYNAASLTGVGFDAAGFNNINYGYNDFYLITVPESTSGDAKDKDGNIVTEPLFVLPGSGDDQGYLLYVNSPALNDGAFETVGVDTDYFGNDLRKTAPYSMGAYEGSGVVRRFIITAAAPENGSVSPAGKTEVVGGNDQTFTITPDEGYVIESVIIDDDQDVTDSLADVDDSSAKTYAFTNVTANHTISVTFNAIDIEQVAAPTADPPSGTIDSGYSVSLSTETADASIYYTTDGSTPASGSALSVLYTEPITVTEDTTIKAIAVKDGMIDSEINTFTYTIEEEPPTEDPFEIVTESLPYGFMSVAYKQTLEAADADTKWTLESGSLPTGLSLKKATGIINGTPTKAGEFTFTVTATLGEETAARELTIIIYDVYFKDGFGGLTQYLKKGATLAIPDIDTNWEDIGGSEADYTYSYKSNNSTIVSLSDADGIWTLKGLKSGTATITLTVTNSVMKKTYTSKFVVTCS